MIKHLRMNNLDLAKRVMTIQKLAYQIEARIIEYEELPPLKESLTDLQKVNEQFYGYFFGKELAGFISFETEEDKLTICRLAVHPHFFKQGIASSLCRYILHNIPGYRVAKVSTGTKNDPAINFYLKHGFQKEKEIRINDQLSITSFIYNKPPFDK
ncbi:MAG: GNAT family N-acetyltransferase [Bacillaceae bacterium]|nr:GNAT family N-acetyltransferase [Bacillaceae bacterium]